MITSDNIEKLKQKRTPSKGDKVRKIIVCGGTQWCVYGASLCVYFVSEWHMCLREMKATLEVSSFICVLVYRNATLVGMAYALRDEGIA